MVRVSEDDILLEEETIQYAEIVLTLDGICKSFKIRRLRVP
jgi:hypothetical protein